jgi:predicted Fe-Mo cluster-binding NifX family protein
MEGKSMIQKVVIPVEDDSGVNAQIAQHFGQAPYFASVELTGQGQIQSIAIDKNTSEHMGGTGHPHDSLLALKPAVIIACAMGQGGLNSFKNAGVLVLKAQGTTVQEVITNFKEGKLSELTGGCPHAHQHHHAH